MNISPGVAPLDGTTRVGRASEPVCRQSRWSPRSASSSRTLTAVGGKIWRRRRRQSRAGLKAITARRVAADVRPAGRWLWAVWNMNRMYRTACVVDAADVHERRAGRTALRPTCRWACRGDERLTDCRSRHRRRPVYGPRTCRRPPTDRVTWTVTSSSGVMVAVRACACVQSPASRGRSQMDVYRGLTDTDRQSSTTCMSMSPMYPRPHDIYVRTPHFTREFQKRTTSSIPYSS